MILWQPKIFPNWRGPRGVFDTSHFMAGNAFGSRSGLESCVQATSTTPCTLIFYLFLDRSGPSRIVSASSAGHVQ